MRIAVRRRRRALASLELALALPFLLLMVVIIFKVAEAGLDKTDTALRARRDAWKPSDQALAQEAKPLPDETLFRAGLRLDGQPGYGVADVEKSRTIGMRPVAPTSLKLGTRLVVLRGTWDYRSIDFPDRRPMHPNPRVWSVIAVGALPPEASQVDVNAFDFSDKPFLTQLNVDQLNFNNLTSGDSALAKIAKQFFEAANPGLAQAEQILNVVKNPAKAAKDLLGTITDLDKLGDAIGKLDETPDAFENLGGMLKDLSDGIDALQDLGVDGPALGQVRDVAKTVGDIADKVRPITDGLKKVKDALKLLKLGKNPLDLIK